MPGLDLFQEADRQLTICNACRYCEGFCPVFRAIETRRVFNKDDVFYLAHLCHDCRACYYACMYTPPHEFAINIPTLMSEVRLQSYRRWSWPAIFARAFTDGRVGILLAGVVAALVIGFSALLIPSSRLFGTHLEQGAFYEIVPYGVMVICAMVLFFYGIAIWWRGGARFWIETSAPDASDSRSGSQSGDLKAAARALVEIVSLRYLKGGGPGCTYPKEQPSQVRRIYHSLVFWGFLADFVSTTLAFIYQDMLHRLPPYPLLSAPVIFGAVGGVGLTVGCVGLIWYKWKSDPVPGKPGETILNSLFIVILGLAALTGMLTLTLRTTSAMGSMLVLHLAMVAALFATAPYGKFVHAVYRSLALLRHQMEEEQGRQRAQHP